MIRRKECSSACLSLAIAKRAAVPLQPVLLCKKRDTKIGTRKQNRAASERGHVGEGDKRVTAAAAGVDGRSDGRGKERRKVLGMKQRQVPPPRFGFASTCDNEDGGKLPRERKERAHSVNSSSCVCAAPLSAVSKALWLDCQSCRSV